MNSITQDLHIKNEQLSHKQNSSVSKSISIIAIFLCFLVAILSSLASVRNYLVKDTTNRKILSKIYTEYADHQYTVLKIKTAQSIEIEIYEKEKSSNQQILKQKFNLNDDSEAYLMINSSALNLSLIDVNKDGFLDIVAPTVDKFGNSRLNVFVYNSDIDQFTLSLPSDI